MVYLAFFCHDDLSPLAQLEECLSVSKLFGVPQIVFSFAGLDSRTLLGPVRRRDKTETRYNPQPIRFNYRVRGCRHFDSTKRTCRTAIQYIQSLVLACLVLITAFPVTGGISFRSATDAKP
jgi:hypothetical protein